MCCEWGQKHAFGSILELDRVISLWEVDEVSTNFYMVLGNVALHMVGKSFLVLIGIGNLLNIKRSKNYICVSVRKVSGEGSSHGR